MNILLVFPTAREASILRGRGTPFLCGGSSRAGDRLTDYFRTTKPDLVLLSGVCGGLDPSLGAGAVILGRQVAKDGEAILEPDQLLFDDVRNQLHASRLPFVASRLLTVDAPAATKDEKRLLWNEQGAGGVDMETYAVARACAAAGVRWLAVRSVVDTASNTLPTGLRSWQDEGDERSALRSAAVRPWEWPAYAILARNDRKSLGALRWAVPAVFRAAKNAKTVETLDLVAV